MSTGTEDFEKLQKLLKLKRHEQPPPGYFNRFPGLLVARLEREGNYAPVSEGPWLLKLWGMLESSPMAAGVFGSALCAMFIFAISAATRVEMSPALSFAPTIGGGMDAPANDTLALNKETHDIFGKSMDSPVSAAVWSSPFAGNSSMTASLQPVSFSTSPQ